MATDVSRRFARRPRPFKDPELMFLTRPQRLRLEHIVNSACASTHNPHPSLISGERSERFHARSDLRKQQKEKVASKPAPFWALVYLPPAIFPGQKSQNARQGMALALFRLKNDDFPLRRRCFH